MGLEDQKLTGKIEMVIMNTIAIFVSLYFMFSWKVQLVLVTLTTTSLFLTPGLLFRLRARRLFGSFLKGGRPWW